MKIKTKLNKLVSNIVNFVSGSGLSQKENIAEGEKHTNKVMSSLIRSCGSEGVVLLKNDGTLPFKEDDVVSVFGRCCLDYFYVGYGSGGDVKPPYKVNLIEGLQNANVRLNTALLNEYKSWVNSNPVSNGYWGHWPYSYDEMELPNNLVQKASKCSTVAVVVIGRAAGEDRENKLEKGSYYLTDVEVDMLDKVTTYFSKVVVVLDCGNIIDMSQIASYKNKISAILYAFQLGMESGNSVADVLTGKVNPSGKLTDTIAVNYKDYPSSNYFGGKTFNNYTEDIFVGYRYFETFNKKVLYPFGYGLSYTTFDIDVIASSSEDLSITATVKNTGNVAGKEVVQVYMCYGNTVLSNPTKKLVAFCKTKLLQPNEVQELTINIDRNYLYSFDDEGEVKKSHFVLEKGKYDFVIGNSVKACKLALQLDIKNTEYLYKTPICTVNKPFSRLKTAVTDEGVVEDYKQTAIIESNLKERIEKSLPVELERTNEYITFEDVKKGRKVEDFVRSLTNRELKDLVCGEGKMNSKEGTIGNAGAYCSSKRLAKRGLKPIITCDGPAGIRLRKFTSLLPCGTSLASTWNEEIVEKLYREVSNEMVQFNVDVLLAPGMNIHRNPLCGRNFEYFSEDPLLSGKMASSCIKGIQTNNKVACPKHFACNNQETNRNKNDSIVSERALREIYLKPFEIAVKEANPLNIMTSYNKVNGVYSHYNYDLATEVLRNEFSFNGVVITDWWMQKAKSPEFSSIKNNAYRVRAGVDVLMPGSLSRVFKHDFDRSLNGINKSGKITRAELQQTAIRIVNLQLYLDK